MGKVTVIFEADKVDSYTLNKLVENSLDSEDWYSNMLYEETHIEDEVRIFIVPSDDNA